VIPDSPFSTPAPATQLPAARAFLAALVCQESVNRAQVQDAAAAGIDPGPLVGPQIIDSWSLWPDFDGVALIYGGIPGHAIDVCGGVRVPLASDSKSEHFDRQAVANAHSRAMVTMAGAVRPMALAMLDSGTAPAPADLDAAAGAYEQSVAAALATSVADANSSFSSWMEGEGGSWIYAGSMLAKVSSISREIQAAASIAAEAVPSAQDDNADMGVLAVARGAQAVAQGAEAKQKTSFSLKNPDLGVLVEPLRSNLVEKVVGWLEGDQQQDLLGGLGNLGHIITSGAVAAAGAILGGLAMVSGGSLGTLGGLAGSAFSVFVFVFCVPLFSAGLMFSYFLPFLPLIYWVSGVLGWLLIFVQALILSPIWMLAHIVGFGDDSLGRAENGYLKMLDLILRPTLMVAGLVAGWAVLLFFGGFLKLSLSVFFGGGSTFAGAGGILGFVATLMLFAYLAHQIVTRAFGLIQSIPDTALSWIGSAGAGGIDDRDIENKAAGAVANIGRSGRGVGPGPGGGPGPGKGGGGPGDIGSFGRPGSPYQGPGPAGPGLGGGGSRPGLGGGGSQGRLS